MEDEIKKKEEVSKDEEERNNTGIIVILVISGSKNNYKHKRRSCDCWNRDISLVSENCTKRSN